MSFLPCIKYEVNYSRNPDVVPVKTGNYWIPHQVRNDKKGNPVARP